MSTDVAKEIYENSEHKIFSPDELDALAIAWFKGRHVEIDEAETALYNKYIEAMTLWRVHAVLLDAILKGEILVSGINEDGEPYYDASVY